MAAVHFLNVYYDALNFNKGSLKSTFSKYSFWKGVTKKSTLCTLLIMLTILDDPLLVTRLDSRHSPRKSQM